MYYNTYYAMPKKIFISTPCYDAMMTMQYTISLLGLVTFLRERGIDFVIDFVGNESLIPRARNHSLGKFMRSDCSHLFFIDADIEFQPDAFMDCLTFNKDVVCCGYPKKGYNWNRLIHSLLKEPDSQESIDSRGLDYAFNTKSDAAGQPIMQQGFLQVVHASTGFMLIKREILEKLHKKHAELEIITDNLSQTNESICGLFCCMIRNKCYLSEDYSFCQRVNDIGGTVWISTAHNLNHVGKHVFRGDIKNRNFLGRTVAEKQLY
jgi:hypothetical protein